MKKILITGGSGFIGTNLVESLFDKDIQTLSIDIKHPQNTVHNKVFKQVDICRKSDFKLVVNDFKPTHIVHLAARTDLDGKTINDYQANTIGVQNLVDLVADSTTIKRAIFTSSKFVCVNGHIPQSDDDYCPDTVYGESKVEGERIVKVGTKMKCNWCIVRPTSIWGPWFDVPYKGFFQAIAKGRYFNLGQADPPKSFGYVGNSIYMIEKLLEVPDSQIYQKTFYISDYEGYTIKEWANAISLNLHNKDVATIPDPIPRLAAWCGDFLKMIGIRNPPITSYRLHNMRCNTSLPLEPSKKITGELPYKMEQGVKLTLDWMRSRNLIK